MADEVTFPIKKTGHIYDNKIHVWKYVRLGVTHEISTKHFIQTTGK